MTVPAVSVDQVRIVIGDALRALDPSAYEAEEGEVEEVGSLHLKPTRDGASDVRIEYDESGLDVTIEDSVALEISAPINVNYTEPGVPWDVDLSALIRSIASGEAVLGRRPEGGIESLSIPGSMMGVITSRHDVIVRPAIAW